MLVGSKVFFGSFSDIMLKMINLIFFILNTEGFPKNNFFYNGLNSFTQITKMEIFFENRISGARRDLQFPAPKTLSAI